MLPYITQKCLFHYCSSGNIAGMLILGRLKITYHIHFKQYSFAFYFKVKNTLGDENSKLAMEPVLNGREKKKEEEQAEDKPGKSRITTC